MEKGLFDRDIVGLQDFILLEDYQSETAFIDNLKKRFQEDLIYVSHCDVYLITLYMYSISIKYQTYLHFDLDIYRSSARISKSIQRAEHLFRAEYHRVQGQTFLRSTSPYVSTKHIFIYIYICFFISRYRTNSASADFFIYVFFLLTTFFQ